MGFLRLRTGSRNLRGYVSYAVPRFVRVNWVCDQQAGIPRKKDISDMENRPGIHWYSKKCAVLGTSEWEFAHFEIWPNHQQYRKVILAGVPPLLSRSSLFSFFRTSDYSKRGKKFPSKQKRSSNVHIFSCFLFGFLSLVSCATALSELGVYVSIIFV